MPDISLNNFLKIVVASSYLNTQSNMFMPDEAACYCFRKVMNPQPILFGILCVLFELCLISISLKSGGTIQVLTFL